MENTIILELWIIRYSWKGLVVYLATIVPQGILYIGGYFLLGCWCLNRKEQENKVKSRSVVVAAFIIVLLGISLESTISLKIFMMILDI